MGELDEGVDAAFRIYPRGHAVRKSAIWALFFIVTESLLGAGLVTFERLGTKEMNITVGEKETAEANFAFTAE